MVPMFNVISSLFLELFGMCQLLLGTANLVPWMSRVSHAPWAVQTPSCFRVTLQLCVELCVELCLLSFRLLWASLGQEIPGVNPPILPIINR